jgi:Putative transposase
MSSHKCPRIDLHRSEFLIFLEIKTHRHLQHDLPALGAAVLRQWAWSRYKVRVGTMVIQHTFGGRLNHNPHLHIMVSAGGLKPAEAQWVPSIEFDREEIMKLWRFAVTSYLWKARRKGLLRAIELPGEFHCGMSPNYS